MAKFSSDRANTYFQIKEILNKAAQQLNQVLHKKTPAQLYAEENQGNNQIGAPILEEHAPDQKVLPGTIGSPLHESEKKYDSEKTTEEKLENGQVLSEERLENQQVLNEEYTQDIEEENKEHSRLPTPRPPGI